MDIDFNIYRLKKDSKTYQEWSISKFMQNDKDCDIIIVGEETLGDKPFLKGCTIGKNGLCLIGGLKLNESSYLIAEEDLDKTSLIEVYDIHKKYLSMDIVEDIQKVNERLMA